MAPGIYQVKVAAPGFDTVVKTNIELQVQQTARIDFALTVGHATQTVEVSATGELLTTENATVGTVIEESASRNSRSTDATSSALWHSVPA